MQLLTVVRAAIALGAVGALVWFAGCSDVGPEPQAASLTIVPEASTLLPEETVQLSATVRDAKGTVIPGHPITWRSDNSVAATVNANGLVTGLTAGSSAVIATSGSMSDTATVTVMTVVPGLIVSDPLLPPALAAQAVAPSALKSTATDSLTYVSLTPNTVPLGRTATIRRIGDQASITTAVLDGGVDPTPVRAQDGDSIEVQVLDGAGNSILVERVAVRPRRPPVVVRTDPRRRRPDVPLNSSIVIVFSEPVAGSSLTGSSVQLFRGTTAIAGTVTLLQGTATTVVFQPAAQLDPNTEYRLVVTRAVRDLEGDALDADVTVEFTTGVTLVGPASLVAVRPETSTVLIGSQVQLIAQSLDTFQLSSSGRPVTWSSETPIVASVSTTGLVSAATPGVARILAEIDGHIGVGVVIVLSPVDSVQVLPQTPTIPATGGIELTAVLRDAAGNVLPFGLVTWGSSDTTVVTLSAASGDKILIGGATPGVASITATSNGKSASAVVTVVTAEVPYVQLAAGMSHACGLTAGRWVLCWGAGNGGQLGHAGFSPSFVPAALVDSLRFSHVSGGGARGCALVADGGAYCWGDNLLGGLGTGRQGSSCFVIEIWGGIHASCAAAPRAVVGGLRFAGISVGGAHICAVSVSGVAYCWGDNTFGQLGIGTVTGPEKDCGSALGLLFQCATAPTAIAGGLTLSGVVAGKWHTCAIASGGAAYCWGVNGFGQLGDGTTTDHPAPVPVAGGLAFVALAAGLSHTCGLTSVGTAYCWGRNDGGQLGLGSVGPDLCPGVQPLSTSPGPCSVVPRAVSGELLWTAINGGGAHTCGITSNGAAYCWGVNATGALGDGTTQSSTTPVAVTGAFMFASLTLGEHHTCGITVAGIAYCWGDNSNGKLGDGTTTNRSMPVKVAGQP